MKYLMLKHYRGAPAGVTDHPMDEWTQDEIDGPATSRRCCGCST